MLYIILCYVSYIYMYIATYNIMHAYNDYDIQCTGVHTLYVCMYICSYSRGIQLTT